MIFLEHNLCVKVTPPVKTFLNYFLNTRSNCCHVKILAGGLINNKINKKMKEAIFDMTSF